MIVCPHTIDFRAWLVANYGIELPARAEIVVSSTYWDGAEREGKPASEWAEKLSYSYDSRVREYPGFVYAVLADISPEKIPQNDVTIRLGPRQWVANLVGFAVIAAIGDEKE